VNTTKVNNTAA